MLSKRQLQLLGHGDVIMGSKGGTLVLGSASTASSAMDLDVPVRERRSSKESLERRPSKQLDVRSASTGKLSVDRLVRSGGKQGADMRRSSLGNKSVPALADRPVTMAGAPARFLQRRRATVDHSGIVGLITGGPVDEEEQRPSSSSSSSVFSKKRVVYGPAADKAALLARKYRLDLQEVQHILKEFSAAKRDSKGNLSQAEFESMVCRVFRVPKVSPKLIESGKGVVINVKRKLDEDKFIEWYVSNLFSHINAMNACQDRTKSDTIVYNLAKQYGVETVVIDKIKIQFDKYDVDSSGFIDCDEFKKMMGSLLQAKSQSDVSEDRTRKFFNEIDTDGSGEIDFSEFTKWYLKYIHSGDDSDVDDTTHLVEAFYNSFNPSLQRRLSLVRRSTII
eukprot:TRINITY_DN18297_c0_g1_i1.p1 TRINITY_DN18297_c0_g1~~TRINITY_DN18297_c0_g1_i1.p1  ORF type:complete len:393 (-),score=96.84 TRINITY_DN18297_c0_g1_i1:77-1255(-)